MSNQLDAIKLIEKELISVNSLLKQTSSELISISKISREVSSNFSNIKTPKEITDIIKKTNNEVSNLEKTTSKLRIQEIKLQKAREKQVNAESSLRDKLNKQREREAKAREREVNSQSNLRDKLNKQREIEAKAIEKSSKLSKELNRAFKIATSRRNELAKTILDLNVKRNLGNNLTIKEQKLLSKSSIEFKKYDSAIKKASTSVNRFQENVGNYPRAFNSATSAAKNLASALGLVGGAFLLVRTVRDSINIVKDFNLTMQTLSGVLRVNRDELKSLENLIISIGATTVKTANETAELSESLATLGESQESIEKLLLPITNLSIGLKTSSEDAGAFLVKMLNTFGASRDEAEKYANTIATIRTSTSLDFQKIRDSFQFLAPISRSLGEDIAYTGSLVGILSDNGIKAERAGRLLSTAQQKLAVDSKSLSDALLEINKAQSEGVKEIELLALASKLFGKQAAGLGIILSNNTNLIDENAEAIRNNSGALDELVDKQLDSLDSSLKLLTSAWQGYILELDSSTGATNFLKDSIDFLAKNLKSILSLIITSTKIWISYKTAVQLARLQTFLMNKQLILSRASAIKSAKGAKIATVSWSNFNKVLKSNALFIAISGITLLVSWLNKLSKPLSETVKKTNESTDAFLKSSMVQEEQSKNLRELSNRYDELTSKMGENEDRTKLNKEEQEELDNIIKEIIVDVPNAVTEIDKYGKALSINTEKVREFNSENSNINKQLEISLLKENREELAKLEIVQSNLNKRNEEGSSFFVKGVGVIASYNDVLRKQEIIGGRINQQVLEGRELTTDELRLVSKAIKENTELIEVKKDLIKSLSDEGKEALKLKKIKEDEEETIKKEVFIIRELRKEISQLQTNLNSLTKNGYENVTRAQADVIVNTRKLISDKEREIKLIIGENKVRKNNISLTKEQNSLFELQQFRLEKTLDLNNKIASDEKKSTSERTIALNEFIRIQNELLKLKTDNELKALDREVENRKKTGEDLEKINIEYNNRRSLIEETYEKERLKNQDVNTEKGVKIFEDGFKERLKIIENYANDSERALQDQITNTQNKLIEQGASTEQIEIEVNELIYKERVKQFNRSIELIEQELRAISIGAEKRKMLEQALSDFKAKLSDENIAKYLEEENAREAILKDSISGISKAINDSFGINSRVTSNFFDTLIKNFNEIDATGKASFENISESAKATFDFVGAITDASFQRRIDNIDAELEASNELYNKILEDETLTEDQRESLEQERDKKEKEIQEQKRKEQIKQAKAQKAFNAASVIANTAVAVSKALAQGGFLLGVPFAGIIAALGAVQLATVLAQPIPKFAEGGEMKNNGLMMINDHPSGRLELVERKGKLYQTDKKNAIVKGEKGDVIHPDANKYISSLSEDEIQKDLNKHIVIANIKNQNHLSDRYELLNRMNSNSDKSAEKIIKAINKQSKPIYLNNNVNVGKDLKFLMYRKDVL